MMSAAKNGKSPGGCGNSQPGQNVRKVCEPSYAPIIACITAAFIIELCLLWFFFSSVPVITTYVPYTVQRNDTLWDIAKKFAPEEMDLREYIQILQEEIDHEDDQNDGDNQRLHHVVYGSEKEVIGTHHRDELRSCGQILLHPLYLRSDFFVDSGSIGTSCLEYHIKNCAGPCIGLQSQEEYLKNIDEIKEILKGNTQEISRMLLEKMQTLAGEMKFEEAQKIKEKYLLIENYRSKSEVVSAVLHNIDVFSIEEDDSNSAFINYLHITNGAINQAFTFEYKKKLNESKEELLTLGIIEMRERYKSRSREIIVPFELDLELNNVVFTVPQRGDKKKLLDLSILNVKQYKADRMKQAEKLNPEQRSMRLMKEIQQELHLERPPLQIECFDNSNIQGSDAVAACVVFKKAKPSKKDYRKYNIKTVVGPDDYASMKEVVKRRYQRAIEESSPLPDLIITDGGKGQMEVVREVIEDELGLNIPIAGLAKDNRHRTSELLFGFPPQTIGIKQHTPLFRLLTQIQDEVHRFAISFHRDKRSKRQVASALDSIKGIGEKTKTALLKEFKSVKRIKEASLEDISAIIGEAKAKTVKEGLNNE